MPPDLVEGIEDENVYAREDEDEDERARPSGARWWRDAAEERSSGRTEQTYEYDSDLFNPRTWTGGRGARKGGAPTVTAPQRSGLRDGMRVRHAQFGEGIILSRERVGNDFKLTFSRVGRKTLIEKYAKLQPI